MRAQHLWGTYRTPELQACRQAAEAPCPRSPDAARHTPLALCPREHLPRPHQLAMPPVSAAFADPTDPVPTTGGPSTQTSIMCHVCLTGERLRVTGSLRTATGDRRHHAEVYNWTTCFMTPGETPLRLRGTNCSQNQAPFAVTAAMTELPGGRHRCGLNSGPRVPVGVPRCRSHREQGRPSSVPQGSA